MIIYDLEIKKGILGRNETPVEGIEYCAGWNDHKNMGISVLCAYDMVTQRYRVFDNSNLDQFADLVDQHDVIVGFNNRRFDNRVIAENGLEIPDVKTYDLLEEIWRGVRLDPNNFNPATHGGFGLEAMCRANFNLAKTGNGALAPVAWQQGKIAEVIDYCLADVNLTKRLLDRVTVRGSLVSPKSGKAITIRRP